MYPRRMYDMEYVKSGCVGAPPPDTTIDDAVGTYVSNYLIGAIAICGAVVVLRSRATAMCRLLGVGFFACTGAGSLIAGVLHQVLHENELLAMHFWWWKLSLALLMAGTVCLDLLANATLFAAFTRLPAPLKRALDGVFALAGGSVIVMTLLQREPPLPWALLSGFSEIALLWVLGVSLLARRKLEAVGAALLSGGPVVQALLAPACGDRAYADCFKDCPLPAPHFNHNALSHLIVANGVLVLALAFDGEGPQKDPAPVQKHPEPARPIGADCQWNTAGGLL